MSRLTTIYDNIAAIAITVTTPTPDVTPAVRNLSQVETVVAAAVLPIRLLMPVMSRSEGRSFNYVTVHTGNAYEITWRITDLMLWLPIEGAGVGLEDVAPHLIDYVTKYVIALRANRKILPQATVGGISSQASVIDATFEPGIFEYPQMSQTLYYGVEVIWMIKELVT